MRFGVLGPVSVVDTDGRAVAITPRMERLLVAILAVHHGRYLSAGTLADLLWGDDLPSSSRKTLQTYVSHVRRAVGDQLRTDEGGYHLAADRDDVDIARFESLAADGRLALIRGDAALAVDRLETSLALWRGTPFGDLAEHPALVAEGRRLRELRAEVAADVVEARLEDGQRGLVPSIEAMLGDEPLRERTWALLMRALYVEGRQADALRAYQRARHVLAETVGIDPGPELQAMEARVLAHDPVLSPGSQHAPPTQYATAADGVEIAFWTRGTGPVDVVFVLEWTMNVELLWDLDELRPFFDQLASIGRLVALQRRDTGVSGRSDPPRLAPPDVCVADIDAVLDHLGVDRAHLVGWGHGGQIALAHASLRPQRTDRVVVVSSYATLMADSDHPGGIPREVFEPFLGVIRSIWGAAVPPEPIFAPEVASDPALIARIARMNRLTFTPSQAVANQREAYGFDIRSLLAGVTCPVLSIGLRQSVTGTEGSRYLADAVPDGSHVELDGHFVPMPAQSDAVGREVVRFLSCRDRGG